MKLFRLNKAHLGAVAPLFLLALSYLGLADVPPPEDVRDALGWAAASVAEWLAVYIIPNKE